MSYSRWSDSFWYTFWSCRPHDSVEPEDRNNAIFEICDVASFEAWQLRDELDTCIAKVADVMDLKYIPPFTDDLKEELLGYIRYFLEDVDATYPVCNNCVQTTKPAHHNFRNHQQRTGAGLASDA